jgi:hypothetical protein
MLNLDEVKQVLTQAGENTLSLYLNVNNALPENQATTPAWRSWLNNELHNLGDPFPQEPRTPREKTITEVRQYLDAYQPTSKGLALFAGENLDSIRTYELAVPIDNQISFGVPLVAPLLWVIDEYEPYLVVLVDQEEARFFTSTLGNVGFEESVERSEDVSEWHEMTTMSNPAPGGGRGAVHGGSGRDDFEKRMDEQRSHLYRDVASRIDAMMQQSGARRLIFGGAEQSVHAVINLLPDRPKAAIVGILPIPLRSTTQQIFEQALPTAQEFERQKEIELVTQVTDFARAGGRGALGRTAVIEAMEMQRVELLVMSWPAVDSELASSLALWALSLNSKIELVHGDAANMLANHDGVAARLYYTM